MTDLSSRCSRALRNSHSHRWIGLGLPLRRALNELQDEETIRGWRVAHSSLVLGGVMLLALVYSDISAVISTASFCYALILGAKHGHLGLQAGVGALANSIYFSNMTGALLSTAGLVTLLYGGVAMLISR